MRWQIVRGARPAVRKWGDEFVVHHALSNDTYRLSAAAGRVLAGLMAADGHHADGGGDSGSTDDADAETCLSTLADLGFVTQC